MCTDKARHVLRRLRLKVCSLGSFVGCCLLVANSFRAFTEGKNVRESTFVVRERTRETSANVFLFKWVERQDNECMCMYKKMQYAHKKNTHKYYRH